jgi:hypothetical protein
MNLLLEIENGLGATMIRNALLAAAAALSLATPAKSAVNLLANGDFESGILGALPSGWNATVASGSELLVLKGASYVPCCGASGSPAALANQFAAFGAGNSNNVGVVLGQSFATVTGKTYNLSFDFGVMGGGLQSLSFSVGPSIGPAYLSNTIGGAANNNLNTTFASYGYSFVAGAPFSVIRFNVDPVTNSVDGILDNVSVSAAVPEPSTWAMMFLGFVGLGFLSRRRRSVAAG